MSAKEAHAYLREQRRHLWRCLGNYIFTSFNTELEQHRFMTKLRARRMRGGLSAEEADIYLNKLMAEVDAARARQQKTGRSSR